MANKGAQLVGFILLFTKINVILGQLIEGKANPSGYVSFPPSTFDEDDFNVEHSIGSCTPSVEVVDGDDENVITCPNGELLLDGVTETNLEDDVTDSDIQLFYTWEERSIPLNDAFITLQFPGETITPTRVMVYCLELRGLKAREPKAIRLYSSTTESIFPDNEIRDIEDNDFVVVNSGRTAQGDDYEYRRYDLIIPGNRQVALNYLRILLDFEGGNWVFISEVEVYHTFVPAPTTTTQMTTTMLTTSSMVVIPSTSAPIETTSMIMASTLQSSTPSSIVSSPPVSTIVTNTPIVFPTPMFIFPRVNDVPLHVTALLSDLPINCTVRVVGDPFQLITSWSYNGTSISSNDKYTLNGGRLTIREFTLQDVGTYTCAVQHPSGWSSSRQYSISASAGGNVIQEPGKGSDSSSGPPIAILAAAAGGGVGLLLCIILTICCIVCCCRRKKANDESNSGAEKSLSLFRPYEYVDNNDLPPEVRKRSIDNVYEHTNTNDSIPEKRSNPPTLPKLPKHFGQPKISELPKPALPKPQTPQTDNAKVYGFLGEYVETSTSLSPSFFPTIDNNEVSFNIYDDTIITPALQSPQDIYEEPFEYGQNPEEIIQNEENNMCLPTYDEPAPLRRDEAPKMVEWDNISILTNIGEGNFGDVFLAETIGIDTIELGCMDTKATRILVAIKTLKGNFSNSLKKQFEKEIKFMARLGNANVVRLLGMCNKGTPFIMIEYMKNGDLHMFLKKHYHLENGKDTDAAEIPVDIPLLLYIALQIANGMRYLASLGFIHRDLAARNCLVGEDYIVKVADFGMTQSLYNTSYFRMRGTALVPIRWMAPESFFGKFSTKTDVWSYGITLWEIFTLCRQQPYEEMSDEDLVYSAQKAQKINHLKRPPLVTDEVFNTMKNCWTHDAKQRLDFEAVYDQLFNYYMQIQ